MRTINLFEQKNIGRVKEKNNRGSTAYHIFDNECQYLFQVNNVHFRMNNITFDLPINYSGERKDLEQVMNMMISTRGTIINMSDYYRDGARLGFEDPKVAAEIYKRILTHLDAHLQAMRSDRMYQAPDDDTLRELAEFATVINYKAREAEPDIDSNEMKSSFLERVGQTRAFISFDKVDTPVPGMTIDPSIINQPKSLDKMDAIERYLAIINGR